MKERYEQRISSLQEQLFDANERAEDTEAQERHDA